MIDEIHQLQELAEVRWAEGFVEGFSESFAERFAERCAQGCNENEVGGKIAAVLALLAARGIRVTAERRARIEACQDLLTLDRWIVRAATAASVEDVLAADPR